MYLCIQTSQTNSFQFMCLTLELVTLFIYLFFNTCIDPCICSVSSLKQVYLYCILICLILQLCLPTSVHSLVHCTNIYLLIYCLLVQLHKPASPYSFSQYCCNLWKCCYSYFVDFLIVSSVGQLHARLRLKKIPPGLSLWDLFQSPLDNSKMLGCYAENKAVFVV